MKTKQDVAKDFDQVQVVRHAQVCRKLQISSAKLFDMCAKGQFPKPFPIIPGGRAVGWLENEIDQWVLNRKAAAEGRPFAEINASNTPRFTGSSKEKNELVNQLCADSTETTLTKCIGGKYDIS